MKRFATLSILAAAVLATGCTRIQTGEVGVRVGFDKQVQAGELPPGSFPQVLIGEVLTFPVKDVNVTLDNMTPVAKDNSTMKDFDAVIVYNINAQQVSELYSTKNKSFHNVSDGDVYLMYNYIVQNARNAIYKAARQYEALDMADNRAEMENYVKEEVARNLAEEKLDGSITISQVMIRNVVPADSVVASANELVRAKNERTRKEVEVDTAKLEAQRMNALASQGKQSIDYMNAQTENLKAQAMMKAAEKGSLMMVPFGATPMFNVNK